MQGEFLMECRFLSVVLCFSFYIDWRQVGVSGVKFYQNFTHLYSIGFLQTLLLTTNKRVIRQYSFDPAGIWSSTMSRCRSSLPSFWLTALMTMPQLSMPIILRGGRLVMAIRVLPMSSSGS